MAPPGGSMKSCLETSQEVENVPSFYSCLPLPGDHDYLPWRRLDLNFSLQAKSEDTFVPKEERGSPILWFGNCRYWEGRSGSKWGEKSKVLKHRLMHLLRYPQLPPTFPLLGCHASLGCGWNTGPPSMGSNILKSLEARMKQSKVQESAPLKVKLDQGKMETSGSQANKLLLLSFFSKLSEAWFLLASPEPSHPCRCSVKAQTAQQHPIALLSLPLPHFLSSLAITRAYTTWRNCRHLDWTAVAKSTHPASHIPQSGSFREVLWGRQAACPRGHGPRPPGSFPRHQPLRSSVASSLSPLPLDPLEQLSQLSLNKPPDPELFQPDRPQKMTKGEHRGVSHSWKREDRLNLRGRHTQPHLEPVPNCLQTSFLLPSVYQTQWRYKSLRDLVKMQIVTQ